jgi:flagellum-specific peptidoglycan hydrolase FlgJ
MEKVLLLILLPLGLLSLLPSKKEEKPEVFKKTLKIPKSTESYIKRFYKVAQQEHKKYGIPASITLAQGIIESASGNSRLVKSTNNHFGIKCFGNCDNSNSVMMKDDKPTDRFKKYKSAWYSYRDHSKLLMKPRYQKCRECINDYKCWAINLKKCGYATSKTYTKAIIKVIEDYDLTKYDK